MAEANAAVLGAVEQTLLDPRVIEAALAHAEASLARERSSEQREQIQADLTSVLQAIRRLTAAIATGGDLLSLVEALKTYDDQRRDLEARLAAIDAPRVTVNAATIRQQLHEYLADWRGLLRGNVQQGQQVLRRLIKGRLTFTPHEAGYYTFSGIGTVQRLLSGVIRNLASPTGFEPVFWP
jgi:hypothetical protein